MGAFLEKNSENPGAAPLREAICEGNREVKRNWTFFCEKVSGSNTRAIFAYLAKTEGRIYNGIIKEDLMPIVTIDKVFTKLRGEANRYHRKREANRYHIKCS